MPYFGQELFERALLAGPMDGAKHLAAPASCLRLLARPYQEATLIRLAYAYEQRSRAGALRHFFRPP